MLPEKTGANVQPTRAQTRKPGRLAIHRTINKRSTDGGTDPPFKELPILQWEALGNSLLAIQYPVEQRSIGMNKR
ncbi:unnamed protein product [Cylicostephanus goldi]|uniref:Uncharacterized protein n=1 Tax=Cylicostephanus goldi TaxID=71465 RepID=A0A3P7MCV0_CYLGO|nr:unnamed protein product [Cylicostephanus goldi]